MSRKVVHLTLDHLAALPGPCRTCLFWELDPVRRGRVEAGEEAGEKEAWVSRVLREWGSCGRVALVDERPVGYLVYAPEAFVPGAGAFPTAPVSPDAVLMTTAYVDPAHAGGGLGRVLVQAMARDLLERGSIGAVEAFGAAPSRLGPVPHPRGRCVNDVDFLGRVGFKTHRAHPTTPRMRMDLRTTLTWREEVEAALERLVGVVRPAPKSARPPSPEATRTTQRAGGSQPM